MKIKDILLPGLKTVSVEASMAEAEKILREHNFRHLPVSDGKKLVGIISDRDIQRATTMIIGPDNKSQAVIQPHKKVSEYMSSPIHKMNINGPLDGLVREMISRKVSSFIIEDQGTDVGIITTEDLLILLLDKLQAAQGPLGKLFRKK